MTEAERNIARALGACSFLPGSWDKRFCRDTAVAAENAPEVALTERQTAWLLRLAHKYRRQLPTKIVEAALDEMERNAERRAACGLPALPDFSPAQGRRPVAKRESVGLPSLPLFDQAP